MFNVIYRSAICTAINAITLALMHAGVAMRDMVVSCSTGEGRGDAMLS